MGFTKSFDNDQNPDPDVWVIRVDENDGTIVEDDVGMLMDVPMAVRIGTSDADLPGDPDFDRANTVVLVDGTSDPPEVVIAGCTNSFSENGDTDLLAIRVDDTLVQPAFAVTYVGGFDNGECAHESVLYDGEVIVVGEESSYGGSNGDGASIWLISIDPDGDLSWQRSWRSSTSPSGPIEIGWDVTLWDNDSRLLIGGWASPDDTLISARDSYDMILINADPTDGDDSGGWVRFLDAYPGSQYTDHGCGVA